MNDALQTLVIKELGPLRLELFELRLGGTKGRPVLDVRIDRTDGEKVTVDDCARASRQIEAKLDEVSFAGSRYVLEVSSPGVELQTMQSKAVRKPDRVKFESPESRAAMVKK